MKTEFHFLLFKTFHAQRNSIRKNMNAFGLSPGQPKVLRYVAKNTNCKLKDIAAYCDVEPATVSKILNNLEEQEMLIREAVKGDKRAMSVSITTKGAKALELWKAHCLEVEGQSLKGFSMEEREKFEEYLSRMYQNLTGKTIE